MLVAVGIFIGYIHPTYTKNIVGLNAEIENYDRAHVAATDYLSKQAEIAEKRRALTEQDVERLKAFLPDGVDNVQLIVDITSLATKSNVTLSDIDVKSAGGTSSASRTPVSSEFGATSPEGSVSGPGQGQGPVDSVDLSLKFSATYENLVSFLSAIESSLRPLDVTSLSLTTSDQGSPAVSMTLRVYWLR